MDTAKVEEQDQHQEVEVEVDKWPVVEDQHQEVEVEQWLVVEELEEEDFKLVAVQYVQLTQLELPMEDAPKWVHKCPIKKQKIENILKRK